MEFSVEEQERYSRHFLLPEVGLEGQHKLKNAKVLVIGAGGLGCPVLLYLAAAGIGNLGIVDFDQISLSNLQRQVLYSTQDINKPKVATAALRLQELNPNIQIITYQEALNKDNIEHIFESYDIIVDATDNFETRYLINDACYILHKPLVYGAIYRFEGQVSVFHLTHNSPTYRCLFPSPPAPENAPSCAEAGVLGILPGIVGTLQANEVIKIILKKGKILDGTLLIIHTLNMQFSKIIIDKNENSANITPNTFEELKQKEYTYSCEIPEILDISVFELKEMIEKKIPIQFIDVREPFEMPRPENLKGLEIPLKNIQNAVLNHLVNHTVVVYCQSGIRSITAIETLQKMYPTFRFFNLKGGMQAWKNYY